MTNTIRYYFKKEVNALLPVLHETYRLVGRYQQNRNVRNKEKLLKQLNIIGKRLQFFKGLIQFKKQAYFDAILSEELSLSDRIIALDIAVGSMHIEFSVPRAYMHKESEALRRVLELSRYVASDNITYSSERSDDILVRGIAASPGVVTGKAAIIRKNSDYKRLPNKSIVVTQMTRPDMILDIDKIEGIVTDLGGSLCHAAIIAREMRIPCVVGTQNATEIIRNKSLISVDGNNGIVKKVK
jgi:phosphoenolpyruvate synthase/pyruvate phosphate dikinase